MTQLKFEDLPDAVATLIKEVHEIKSLLLQLSNNPSQQSLPDRWFDINELREYLPDKPSKSTIYSWIHHSAIPHHKRGKKLAFLKSDIDFWLKESRVKTLAECTDYANLLLKHKKQKL